MKNKNLFRLAFGSELDFIAKFFAKENSRAIKTFMGILIKSSVLAILFSIIWLYTIRSYHIQMDSNHAELMRNAQMSLVGIYLSLVYIALQIVLKRYYKLVDYLIEPNEDKEKAREYYHKFRKKTFPMVLNLLIAFFSLMLIAIILLMPYKTSSFGFWEVFLTIFSLYAVFKVFLHLEDPTSGIWPLINLTDLLIE